ncbi:MAG: type II secretion system minor pseudopilin GspH [Pseudomonadota bacterium]
MRKNNFQRSLLNQGFTLLEIIVAMAVMVIVIGVMSISISGRNINEQVKTEAKRFANVLRVVQQEAIFNSVEVGAMLSDTSYLFLLLEENQWLPLVEDKLFEERQLPEGIEFALAVDGFASEVLGGSEDEENLDLEEGEEEEEQIQLTPQIYFLSSGEMSPFVVHIGVEGEYEFYYRVEGYYDGRITLDGPYQGNFREDVALDREIDRVVSE